MTESRQNSGLALCTGCGIGKCLDGKLLLEHAAEGHAELSSMEHPALCSEAGLDALKIFLHEEGIGKLLVAACSPRVKEQEFSVEGVFTERSNLREQICWLMEGDSDDIQACAGDQLRMGLAKLGAVRSNDPYIPDELHKDVLVVGGGMAGLQAALQGARSGRSVHLVEKSGGLGGYARSMYRELPVGDGQIREVEISKLVQEVEEHDLISTYMRSLVDTISGEPGNFRVKLAGENPADLGVGAVVTATGWKAYEPSRLAYLGYGMEKVKTLEEFEVLVQEEEVPDRVLFVLCAGSRDPEHLPYCSGYCCSAALKQALYVREKNPQAEVYLIYRDIRTPAFQESFYRMVQSDDAILMTRGRVDTIKEEGSALSVSIRDSLIGDAVSITTDMVVLATGMVPNSTQDLKLQYRLGEGLPELEYEFADSHFICFPYESRRTGIYAAGALRAPMDLQSSAEDGAGAMMKAIQCIECTGRGEAVHPRSGDQTWPELYMERCTDCKRCTEECPFGAYDETEKGTPLPNPARCRRCGICLGSCPERVIGFTDYSINSVSAMIKSVSMPDEFEEKPRILVFLCENDAYPALDAAGVKRLNISPFVRIIPVRCLGSVNKVWISDALSHGYDGILQIGCKPGDDYQCHFIHGSELTEQRGENLQETLETMMLEPERIATRFVEITEHHRIAEIINDYAEEVELMGPNPFKSL